MRIINYLPILLFIAFTSYAEVSQENKALFNAIERGDFRAVNKALHRGASINAINEATGDTPIFLATKKLLKMILEAYDDCYINSIPPKGRWLKELRQAVVSIAAVLGGITLGNVISKRYSKLPISDADFIIFPIALGVSFLSATQLNISIDDYFRNKKIERIPSFVAIINLLAISYGCNKTYIHPKMNTAFQEWLTNITHAKPSGIMQLVNSQDFIGTFETFVDQSYKFVLDDKETVYCSQEAYLKYVKPAFEKLVAVIDG